MPASVRAHDNLEVFKDISFWFPKWQPHLILDVGANVGQSCRPYAKFFPDAVIHAFEPNPGGFEKLKDKTQNYDTIIPWRVALTNKDGPLRMTDNPANTNNRVVEDGGIEVRGVTGRTFCAEHLIDHIDFLKVDAEAHDVEVLEGFDLSICDFVQVETMINRHDPQGSMYADVYNHMVANEFYVFNFYCPVWEWKRGTMQLEVGSGGTLDILFNGAPIRRRMDTVFINPKLVQLS
jgi:FkbM family methyltransferase